MVQMNIHQAKTQLSQLIEQALAGEEVVIARAGAPVVRLVAIASPPPREWGQFRGQVHMADDFDTLPDVVAAAFADPKIFPDEP